jgi:hypothetical protein
MKEFQGLYDLLLARQPPGLRALGQFWATVGLTLGVGTAVLGYLGPLDTGPVRASSASTAVTLDRTAASRSEIVETESPRIAVIESVPSFTRLPMLPAPMLDDMAVARAVTWPVAPSVAESTVKIDVTSAAEAAAQLVVPRYQVVASTPAAPPTSSPRVVLATSRGARPVYRVGESMTLRIQPTQDAYIYCYYQDEAGDISRIYPNRFQPDAFVAGRSQVEVPPAGSDAFSIRFEQPGMPEQVACLAADHEVGLLLPPELKLQDLKPLPVRRLDEVAQHFRRTAGVLIDDARLPIEVMR